MLNTELERLKSDIRNGHTILSLPTLGYGFDHLVIYGVRYGRPIRVIDYPISIKHHSVEIAGGSIENYILTYYNIDHERYDQFKFNITYEHVYYNFDTREIYFITDLDAAREVSSLFKSLRGYYLIEAFESRVYYKEYDLTLCTMGNTGNDYFPPEIKDIVMKRFNKDLLSLGIDKEEEDG